jgi:predicted nucleotidyltransferase
MTRRPPDDKLAIMNRAEVIARLKAAEPALRARGVAALYLYGSYARDEGKEDSDLDILVDFAPGQGKGLSNFLAPVETLEERFPGKQIGFSTRDSIVPIYLPSIERSAIRVF